MSYANTVETLEGKAVFFGVTPTLLQQSCAKQLLTLGVQVNAGLTELANSLPEGYTVEFRGKWDCLVIKGP